MKNNSNNNNSLEIDTVYHQNNQKSKISPVIST